MPREIRSLKTGSAPTVGLDKNHSAAANPRPRPVVRPVSRKSEAIIKEVSVRRRTAMRVLANR